MADLILLPIITPDKNKLEDAYEVVDDLSIKRKGQIIRVPRFFQFDGASTPPAAWQLIGSPFVPRFMNAAVFHDWLYHTHQIDRETTDELFHDLLVSNGVNEVKASLMCAAVANFGEWYWENDDDDQAYLKRLAARIRKDGRDPADYGMN